MSDLEVRIVEEYLLENYPNYRIKIDYYSPNVHHIISDHRSWEVPIYFDPNKHYAYGILDKKECGPKNCMFRNYKDINELLGFIDVALPEFSSRWGIPR